MDPESREARKRLIRSDRATRKRPIQKPGFPWPPNVPRGPQESHFKQFEVLGRQTPPGGPQEARFKHFGPLAAKRPRKPQEAPGKPQEPREPHEPREAPEAQGAQGSPRSPGSPRRLQGSPGGSPGKPQEAPGAPICTKPPKSMRFTMLRESTFATLARNDNFSHHCTNKHAFCDEFSHFSHHSAAKRSLPTPFRPEMDPILTQNCPKHAQQPRSPVFYERFWLSPAPLCSQTSTLRSKNADVCSETSDSVKSDSTLQPNARLPHFRGPLGVPGGTRRPQSLGKVRWSNK